MEFFDIIVEKGKRKFASLILYCLLDRIPIIVFGDDAENIDDLINALSELIHFRKDMVFYTDFISREEHENLIQNESLDYNSQKVQIRCPSNASRKAITQIDNFKSWLLGFEIKKGENNALLKKEKIREILLKNMRYFLIINIDSNKFSIMLEGLDSKSIDLTLEQNILQKILSDTEKSIAKMKRVLTDKTKISQLDEDLVKTLLDFEGEKIELKKNIFKSVIQNFYSGSKRAFFILTRLNLLNSIEENTRIGSKTLLETIDYEEAPIERILSFVKEEWGENFTNLIEGGKKSAIGDKIVSLWG